jgi:hypothetical protein
MSRSDSIATNLTVLLGLTYAAVPALVYFGLGEIMYKWHASRADSSIIGSFLLMLLTLPDSAITVIIGKPSMTLQWAHAWCAGPQLNDHGWCRDSHASIFRVTIALFMVIVLCELLFVALLKRLGHAEERSFLDTRR